jgi:hypothetical protein
MKMVVAVVVVVVVVVAGVVNAMDVSMTSTTAFVSHMMHYSRNDWMVLDIPTMISCPPEILEMNWMVNVVQHDCRRMMKMVVVVSSQ